MLFGPVVEGKRIAAAPLAALVRSMCGSGSVTARAQNAALHRLPSSRIFGDGGQGNLPVS